MLANTKWEIYSEKHSIEVAIISIMFDMSERKKCCHVKLFP